MRSLLGVPNPTARDRGARRLRRTCLRRRSAERKGSPRLICGAMSSRGLSKQRPYAHALCIRTPCTYLYMCMLYNYTHTYSRTGIVHVMKCVVCMHICGVAICYAVCVYVHHPSCETSDITTAVRCMTHEFPECFSSQPQRAVSLLNPDVRFMMKGPCPPRFLTSASMNDAKLSRDVLCQARRMV